jgi:type IV pilus assembly protein PilA
MSVVESWASCNNCPVVQPALKLERRPRSRGFTLVELLVVVAMAGVLATIGLAAMNKHIDASKGIEVSGMVQSIRAAQETYKAMTGIYLDVSSEGGLYPRDPSGADGESKVAFFHPPGGAAPPDNARWMQLAPTVAGPVQYGYMTRAGLPGTPFPEPQVENDDVVFPTSPTESWYLIEAVGDVDGDEDVSYFYATSLNGGVYSLQPSE